MLLSITLALLPTILAKTNLTTLKWGKKYDFVVVGAGTAGSILAGRLSQDWKVLLLEAGQQPPLLSSVPSLAQNLQLTTYNWGYLTQPQNNLFKGMVHNRMLWSSGRVLGGTASINYMIYEQGHAQDYDRWAQMGNTGWSYQDLVPYFHSTGLPLEFSYASENGIRFLKAGEEMGYNITDYNRGRMGFSRLQGTTKDGARVTTADVCLEPFLNRTNLEVVLLAEVVKIQINSTKKRATGVLFLKGNRTYRVAASKEVILSAGAFNSPKLLMLSGIGPGKVLKRLKIRPLVSLPVGQGLGDHVTYPGLTFITNQSSSTMDTIKKYLLDFPGWYLSGKGVFSSLANFEALGLVNVDTPASPRPNVELLFLNSRMDKSIMNLKQDVYRKLYRGTKDNTTWSIYVTLLHPKSRGRVELQSKLPQDLPSLQPGYFSKAEDMRTMLKAIKFVLAMSKTREFRKVGSVLNPNPVPGCESLAKDEYWECAVRTLAVTGYDPFGSCRMGPGNDTGAVVDDQLRVHGVNNLRVIDASVIADTVSGRLMGAVAVVAERGVDLVRAAHRKTV